MLGPSLKCGACKHKTCPKFPSGASRVVVLCPQCGATLKAAKRRWFGWRFAKVTTRGPA